ncbi:alkylresorcinol/alkylpyrone synthase [Rhizomicrobium palustre]|uniref:Alkylresorcinol/alkylpyrone synthase n=1 Tax=Rhizomicrobium palustre TaxID=189966 RepID=A0A846N109_9PROT|nr:type III polyketide synthase [Rhizomicrobium palustre]NIK89396.1 alkylresorcinol/alkylpyrone synthase [Rhizomicrobium palustre]
MQVRLSALATAVPPFVLEQRDVAGSVEALLGSHENIRRLLPVFENAGIDRRYCAVSFDWFAKSHGWQDRNAMFVRSAVALLEEVSSKLLASAGLQPRDIDAIVTVSTSGIATPSLDALLIEQLSLRRDVKRLPIFGLGCAGGVIGLSRAADIAKAMPGSNVLFLVVELCTLNFRKEDLSKSNIVATALFGDGAAGALLSTEAQGPVLGPSGEHTWPHSLDVMGWEVEDQGLKAIFSTSIPALIERDMRAITDTFLADHQLSRRDIALYASHPGGAKVLDALEHAFEIETLSDSRAVLSAYGNMSAVTALFVLARMNWRKPDGRILLSAMGPGFTAAFQLLGGPS